MATIEYSCCTKRSVRDSAFLSISHISTPMRLSREIDEEVVELDEEIVRRILCVIMC